MERDDTVLKVENSTRPAPSRIDIIGIRDERSANLVPVWQYVLGLCRLAIGVSVEDLEALLAEYERTDALLPILDPTRYREQMRNIPQHREITRAVLDLRRTIDRVQERERQGR